MSETKATEAKSSYVVQRDLVINAGSGRRAWEDVATVEVPAHSKRPRIIAAALAESGVKPEVGGEPLRLRVLDARAAVVTTVAAKAVEPTLELS